MFRLSYHISSLGNLLFNKISSYQREQIRRNWNLLLEIEFVLLGSLLTSNKFGTAEGCKSAGNGDFCFIGRFN